MSKRKKKGRKKLFTFERKLSGEVIYSANLFVSGNMTLSEQDLDGISGKSLQEKVKRLIMLHLSRTIPGARGILNINYKPHGKSGEDLLGIYATRMAEEEKRLEEEKTSYLGMIIGQTTKKLVEFTYAEIKDSWDKQKDIWGDWKTFIPIFLDDKEDGGDSVELVDLEQGDEAGTYKISNESDLRKKLLTDFPDDAEKLGYKKMEQE